MPTPLLGEGLSANTKRKSRTEEGEDGGGPKEAGRSEVGDRGQTEAQDYAWVGECPIRFRNVPEPVLRNHWHCSSLVIH